MYIVLSAQELSVKMNTSLPLSISPDFKLVLNLLTRLAVSLKLKDDSSVTLAVQFPYSAYTCLPIEQNSDDPNLEPEASPTM